MSNRQPFVAGGNMVHPRTWRMSLRLVVAVLAAALALVPIVGGASERPPGNDATLSGPMQLVRWTGQLRQNGPSVPLPLPCLEELCHDFGLTVALPAGIWSRAGGVQIGIRASRGTTTLYVFNEDDELVARSGDREDTFYNLFFGQDNSVILPEADNGHYRVVVVSPPLNEQQDVDSVTYEGYAEVEYFPHVQPVRDLLPNLVVFATSTVRIPVGTGVSYGFVEEGFEAGGCLLEEIVEAGARKCLRFNTTVGNIGDGPFEVRYQHALEFPIMQRVYSSNGESYEREAGPWEVHPTHAHLHIKDYVHHRLWRSNSVGDKLDTHPVRIQEKAPHQESERDKSKNGVCVADTDNIWFGRKGDAARAYSNTFNCGGPGPIGISVGWADTYTYTFPDQYIEISGIADGYYLLETGVNPLHAVAESDMSDNSTWVLIRICGNQAELVGKESRCSP